MRDKEIFVQIIDTFKSHKALYNNIELQKTLLILIAMTYLTIEKYKSSQKEVNNG